MFKKRISIFGKSVPLAAVVLGALATVAFASWLVIVATQSINITSASFNSSDLYVLNYTKGGGAAGCNVNLSTGAVSWANAKLGESCTIVAEVHNDSPLPAVLNLDKSLADPGVVINENGHAGAVIAPAGIYNYTWTISLDPALSSPDTNYVFTFDLTALPQ